MQKKVIIIGAGFSGLAAAATLASEGMDVLVLEKNSMAGGRARKFEAEGFTFDMGPSWYWMPDIFEEYFGRFGKKPSEYYNLLRLDPSYQIFFGPENVMEVPASMADLETMFEDLEPGSLPRLRKFLAEAKYKYEVGMREFVRKPGSSVMEFVDLRVVKSLIRLQMFSSLSKQVRSLFSHEKLIKLLEFPVLFLGATPQRTPAMYSLMNYADLALGTWYPLGGMHKVVEGMVTLARDTGVQFLYDEEVVRIEVTDGRASSVHTHNSIYDADAVVGSADYHHIEQHLLPKEWRTYSKSYWESRTMAPSSLLYYLGVDKKLNGLLHHNLFFDEDFGRHAEAIYDDPAWPDKPLFYVCAPSRTDASVAPTGKENLFLLIPLAPGLKDTPERREHYYSLIMERLEKLCGGPVRDHVVYKRSYAHSDFEKDYHAYKGNAYGLANTLRQTAFLKPKMRSSKVSNFFFTGQLTTPGPGVPPALISGQVVAAEVCKYFKQQPSTIQTFSNG